MDIQSLVIMCLTVIVQHCLHQRLYIYIYIYALSIIIHWQSMLYKIIKINNKHFSNILKLHINKSSNLVLSYPLEILILLHKIVLKYILFELWAQICRPTIFRENTIYPGSINQSALKYSVHMFVITDTFILLVDSVRTKKSAITELQ